jgi:hypothetical protein
MPERFEVGRPRVNRDSLLLKSCEARISHNSGFKEGPIDGVQWRVLGTIAGGKVISADAY